MRTRQLITGSPSTGMKVEGELPYGPNGLDRSSTDGFRLLITPYGAGASGKQLTPAGLQAAILRINTYVAALSTANRDLLLAQFVDPSVTVQPRYVSYPVLNMADALTECAAWATLIGTGANVVAF